MNDLHLVSGFSDDDTHMCDPATGTEEDEVTDIGIFEFFAFASSGLIGGSPGNVNMHFAEDIACKSGAIEAS